MPIIKEVVVSCIVERMADRHVSVPRLFSKGDVGEWFQWFEICSRDGTMPRRGFEAPDPIARPCQSGWR